MTETNKQTNKIELTGTDHQIPHLYDMNTFQCYVSANVLDIGVSGAINQACLNFSVSLLFLDTFLLAI